MAFMNTSSSKQGLAKEGACLVTGWNSVIEDFHHGSNQDGAILSLK